MTAGPAALPGQSGGQGPPSAATHRLAQCKQLPYLTPATDPRPLVALRRLCPICRAPAQGGASARQA